LSARVAWLVRCAHSRFGTLDIDLIIGCPCNRCTKSEIIRIPED
jgi:hypothetical protein